MTTEQRTVTLSLEDFTFIIAGLKDLAVRYDKELVFGWDSQEEKDGMAMMNRRLAETIEQQVFPTQERTERTTSQAKSAT